MSEKRRTRVGIGLEMAALNLERDLAEVAGYLEAAMNRLHDIAKETSILNGNSGLVRFRKAIDLERRKILEEADQIRERILGPGAGRPDGTNGALPEVQFQVNTFGHSEEEEGADEERAA